MTARQMMDLYWHQRDKDGEIMIPDPPAVESHREVTLADRLAEMELIAGLADLPAAEVERMRAELRAKYG